MANSNVFNTSERRIERSTTSYNFHEGESEVVRERTMESSSTSRLVLNMEPGSYSEFG